ncbi:MAG: GNAT family N-acetyltransferase [Saprospiraceae bacterium]|jgi:GNAT superfamily N-acetyltransferase|nr:GNAT family N-acetyltransferase [Saprospiraceae bacterium]MBL0023557.1 GNAT family N-acetyltransferase [Saprospiraceae bacterium]
MQSFIIRKAELQDISSICNLVHELAVYEKEPEALKIGIKEYQEAFIEGLIDSIVAEYEGKVVGITVFYMTFSTWRGKCLYLEDFYVQPEYRKYGIGQKLFEAYLSEAKSRGAKLTRWQVLDWNEIALNFYHKNHAIIEKNWWNGKLFFNE